MDNLILLGGALLASPFFFFLGRFAIRTLFSFRSNQVTVSLTTPSGKKYSRKIAESETTELIKQLDEVIAKAKASKEGHASE